MPQPFNELLIKKLLNGFGARNALLVLDHDIHTDDLLHDLSQSMTNLQFYNANVRNTCLYLSKHYSHHYHVGGWL